GRANGRTDPRGRRRHPGHGRPCRSRAQRLRRCPPRRHRPRPAGHRHRHPATGPFAERIDIVHAVDDELPELLTDLGIESISAILLDLGVSSLQLDEDDRGFSYSRPAPLDMRMDRTQELTAAEVLATYSEADLRRILREYGEE